MWCDREAPAPSLEQFENIERLLAEALSLDESRRRSFLLEHTSDSTAADLIESLIESGQGEGDSDIIRTGGALAGQFGRSLLERFGEVDEPNLLAPGTKIGSLCIKRLVGAGGMGAVYAAFDEKLERWVAVKTLRAQKGVGTRAKERFLREARSLARFDHPGICRIYDFVEQEEERYLILELIHGVSLGQFAGEGLSTKECLRVVQEIAEALVVAHGAGIVHRDLKPDNVMIEKQGKVRLTDFGIALWQGGPRHDRHGDGETPTGEPDDQDASQGSGRSSSLGSGEESGLLTCSGSIVGTIRYMSPEQARGEPATIASDIYALGLLLQELITGEPAYEPTATRMELLPLVAEGACRPPDQVTDAELRTLIRNATALDPAARPTAADFVRRITSIRKRPERRKRRLKWAMAVLMVIVAAAVTFSLSKPRPLLESGQRGRIILLPLENATGDPDLDWIEEGLTRMVAETLDATEGIEIVPSDRVSVALGDQTAPIDSETLVALDRALGAELAVMAKVTGGAGNIEVEYTTVSISGSVGKKSFRSGEIIEAGRSLGTRLARRLRPDSMPQDLVDTFSDSPFLNRLYAMGVDHLERGDPMRAGPYFKVCLDRDEVFGWAALKLATAEEKMGRGEEGAVQARRALDVAESRSDTRLAASARIELSTLAAIRGDSEEATRQLDGAIENYRKIDDEAGEARSLYARGRIEYGEARYEDAQQSWSAALDRFDASHDIPGQADGHNALALVEMRLGRMEEAEVGFRRAIELAKVFGDLRRVAIMEGNLSGALIALGRSEEARALLLHTLSIHESTGDRPNALADRFQLGLLDINEGGATDALADDLQSRLVEVVEIGDRDLEGFARELLVNLLEKLGRVEEAWQALKALEALNTPYSKNSAHYVLKGRLLYSRGDARGAVEMFQLARDTPVENEWGEDDEAALAIAENALATGEYAPLPERN